jgi:teichuronic acid biosynthesis glycosyltransferase TuaC
LKKRLLFISTIFPSIVANRHATYSVQLLSALAAHCDIDIINPIPWLLKKYGTVPYTESLQGMMIYHPTYWYTPGLLRRYYGPFYYASIKKCALEVIKGKGHEVILSSWLYPDGWAAAQIAKSCSIPLYMIALGTDANRLVKASNVAEQTIHAISLAEKTICMSHAMKEKLVAVGVHHEALQVMYNGVNRDIFRKRDKHAARRELKISTDERVVLFVGNLLKTKGLDELSDAFARICKYNQKKANKLIIAGAGKYKDELMKRLVAGGLIDSTCFMGSCSLHAVSTLMNAADVVCLPSYSEGLPNVVLEALCCNAKVVATQVGGIPELQAKHRNLYLCPPKDARKLAEILDVVLDAECYEDKASDIYSWQQQAEEIAGLVLK